MTLSRPPRLLILGTAWSGNGGHTVNRELAGAFAQLNYDVTLRIVGPAGQAPAGVRVQSLDPDAIPGLDDPRGHLLRTDGLPRRADGIDVIVGAGRFSGGAASYLRDRHYPQAKVVHFVHAVVDELDRWRGDPEQANRHASTERKLIGKADLAVGVGPLLTEEAIRLARMCEHPPPVHELIAGAPIKQPPTPQPGQRRLNVLLFGRAGDPLKGADTAAYAVGELYHNRGLDVQLTVRGADPGTLQRQEQELSSIARMPVKVRGFSDNQTELDADLRGADLVVIPSRQDGFALTAMEAAGMGVPVLAGSNIGIGIFLSDPTRVPTELGRPSVVPMLGNEDAAELGQRWADHAEPLLRNIDQSRQRALALREHFKQHYTWKHAAERLHTTLEQITARTSGHARELEAVRLAQASGLLGPYRPPRSSAPTPSTSTPSATRLQGTKPSNDLGR
ncbi:glycosyltransferase family 4 protein [Actinomadura kijaniata]|uniref:glycosyltransferase family 4 protein n=1 Tax=Actinomadura kijaniata TaxID=46161 RepID=UPI003F19B93C